MVSLPFYRRNKLDLTTRAQSHTQLIQHSFYYTINTTMASFLNKMAGVHVMGTLQFYITKTRVCFDLCFRLSSVHPLSLFHSFLSIPCPSFTGAVTGQKSGVPAGQLPPVYAQFVEVMLLSL